jgi:hypothetical protein
LLHLLTGLDSSWLGELGLQTFCFAQVRSRKAALYIFGGMLHCVSAADNRQGRLLNVIAQGLAIGATASCVFAHKLEEYVDEPIEDVRQRLAIRPFEPGSSCSLYGLEKPSRVLPVAWQPEQRFHEVDRRKRRGGFLVDSRRFRHRAAPESLYGPPSE